MKNHGNQPKTMKNHETTLKNHGNQPKTMKNHETTLKNYWNQSKTMKTMKPSWKNIETNQKPWNYHGNYWNQPKTMKPPWKTIETNPKPWNHLEKPIQPTSIDPKCNRHQHWVPTDLLWLKNVTSLTGGPNWPPLIKKRYVTHGGPQPTSFD